MSEDSQRRLERNPLRLLDSKDAGRSAVRRIRARVRIDLLCEACREHFEARQELS